VLTACFEKEVESNSDDNKENDNTEEGSNQGDCIDGIDNDGDGLIDWQDDGCASKPSNPSVLDTSDDCYNANTSPSWGTTQNSPSLDQDDRTREHCYFNVGKWYLYRRGSRLS